MVNHRQLVVRIGIGVAVAGKMLCRGQHPLALQPQHILYAQLAHSLAVGAKRASANHRVLRVGVYVHHRGKVDVYAHFAALSANLLAHPAHQRVGIGRQTAEPGILGKRETILQPHAQPPLCINGHKQRDACIGLQLAGLRHLTLCRAHKKAHSPHSVAIHALRKLSRLLVGHVQRHTHHHQLRHLLLDRHLRHQRVDPTLLRSLKRISLGIEMLCSCRSRCHYQRNKCKIKGDMFFHLFNCLSIHSTCLFRGLPS